MQARSRRWQWAGPSGTIELLEDLPLTDGAPALHGVAVIAHPHPLFGGTLDNKVVATLARAFVLCGWRALRFNFRGVGASSGVHDDGHGETDDLLAVIDYALHDAGASAPLPLALAGFSFGAFVTCRAVEALGPARAPQSLVLVGTAASRFAVPPIPHALHEHSLVVHGEADDTVPLADVLQWARPQTLPITVVPGGSHFFHGQLPLLRSLVVRHLHAHPLMPR